MLSIGMFLFLKWVYNMYERIQTYEKIGTMASMIGVSIYTNMVMNQNNQPPAHQAANNNQANRAN